MKKILILFLLPALAFAQKKDEVYSKLADATCDCVHKTTNPDEQALGLCVFQAIGNLSEKEKKAIGFSPDLPEGGMEKIAENVGISMAMHCPDVISKLSGLTDKADTGEFVPDEMTFTGNVEQLENTQFKTVTVIGENNEKKQFIWLSTFEGDKMFINNKISKGDKLEIQYVEHQYFDTKSNTYKTFNEITSAKLL